MGGGGAPGSGSPWPQSSVRGDAELRAQQDSFSPEYYGHTFGAHQVSNIRGTSDLLAGSNQAIPSSGPTSYKTDYREASKPSKEAQEATRSNANPEDKPIGSSAAEAEILSRKLQSAVQGQDLLSTSGRSVKSTTDDLLGAEADKGGATGFKKIALPFFRWFGDTANTPGYRRIKVGVVSAAFSSFVGHI